MGGGGQGGDGGRGGGAKTRKIRGGRGAGFPANLVQMNSFCQRYISLNMYIDMQCVE